MRVLERWFSNEFRDGTPADWPAIATCWSATPVEGYIGTCATLRDTDLTETTRRLTQPTLCLVGAEDGATPPELVEIDERA